MQQSCDVCLPSFRGMGVYTNQNLTNTCAVKILRWAGKYSSITLAVGKLVNFCDHKAITRMFIGKHATNFSMGKCLIRC